MTSPARTGVPPIVPPGGDLELFGVGRRYGEVDALRDIRLHIPAGSLTAVVGPSGCGKSTLLRVLSGLETPDSGTIALDGADLHGAEPGTRGIAMVFQDYALYPHMTVAQNISFGLRLRARRDRRSGPTRAEIAARVGDVADLLSIGALLSRRPAQLSGGQRQRVALARALVRRPPVLLLDEPLSALDAQVRATARAEIVRLHRETGTTLVLVTHDQQEALAMATELVVMRDGRIVQSGAPEHVYREPVDEFVARFLGDPPMNVTEAPDGARIGWRAEDAQPFHPDATGLRVTGTAELTQFSGASQTVSCRTGSGEAFVVVQPAGVPWWRAGDLVDVVVPDARVWRFPGGDG